ncbi:MAG TPA: cupredoxin domain-containing protein [Pyrinomonadaceae bacterium]|nr:cupredoxin domain-containing protein [Pyrinomonadaceae bacterium]
MIKPFIFTIITTGCLFLYGCNSAAETKKENTNTNQTVSEIKSNTKLAKFKAEFKANPAEVKAGEQTELSFTVKNEKGEIVKDLPIVHEKPMHLLVVSDDLAEYYHVHPDPQADGSYKVPFTFQNGGNFKLYADFTPKDSAQVVENFMLKVSGNERAKVELKADEKFEKTIDGLKFVMKPDADLVAGKELMLNFSVFDEKTNKPVTDLEKYLGEYAHFVIISQDLKQFVHAHPMSKGEHSEGSHDMSKMNDANKKIDESKPHTHDEKSDMKDMKMASPSEVSAHTSFPQSGLFKIFAQFQRTGKVITVPFVVNVKANSDKTDVKGANIPDGATKITVSKNGYEPTSIDAKKGEKMTLAFYRADTENCGGEVVFPKLKITKKLPVGETVLVEITPTESGELAFACGMDMLKGKVLVQ